MHKNKTIYFAAVLVFIFVGYFAVVNSSKYVKPEDTKTVKIGGTDVGVDLAITAEEQMLGLSVKDVLAENEGMLFIFPKSGRYDFWMQGMKFPIDIIWLDEKKTVIYIKENATPDDPFKTFGPDRDSRYVLEVVSGFSKKHNIKAGDRVEFSD